MQKAIDSVYGVIARMHGTLSVALVWLCRRLDRGLSGIAWSCKLGFLSVILGGATFHCGRSGWDGYSALAQLKPEHIKVLGDAGIMSGWTVFSPLLDAVGFLLMLCSLLALWRHRYTHLVLKVAAAAFIVVNLGVLGFIIRIPIALLEGCDKELFVADMRNELWLVGFAAWLVVAAIGAVFTLCLSLRSTSEFYVSGSKATAGDRIVENLRTHGEDPNYRTSTYWSAFIHTVALFILPLLMLLGPCQSRYRIQKGSGSPVAEMIKVKKIKKKPEKKFVLNPNSAIIFWVPKIEFSDVMEEVDEATENQYEATAATQGGKLGKGGGKRGGWPNGMENGKVRFIRLKYAGGDWDQQMGKGADYNFLIKFKELTGFKIAKKTEAIPIAALKRFPKKGAPPFVYLTGSQSMTMSQREMKTLRWYLLEEGGMIFADNGGGTFDQSLKSLMRRVLPEKPWIDISNDDVIYRQPYRFAHGAPPLWHHSGTRALGMKHNGRWVVFYHQGDINDAWQEGGSGVTANTRKAAFKMGINVVNYSFNQYLAIHFGE
ncbi:MAG: DUF4159 domain-containing protein [Verrucomicrobia bacterium]|jgi:hypothetical protein|nr:DUF4159 domain-containing protein [Verrucomicrobiota bacterium]MBT7701075.1 DUF4159 domain-containing protein [Verrucomicrobiota bacterium]